MAIAQREAKPIALLAAVSAPFAPAYVGIDPPPTDGLEFTGLRVHVALNRDDYRDEVLAFHGASYFRAVGKGSVHGLSARGLAIDLGEPKPEEFPRFSRLVLMRPGPGDHALWLLALLESPRATGAYAFHPRPSLPPRAGRTSSCARFCGAGATYSRRPGATCGSPARPRGAPGQQKRGRRGAGGAAGGQLPAHAGPERAAAST